MFGVGQQRGLWQTCCGVTCSGQGLQQDTTRPTPYNTDVQRRLSVRLPASSPTAPPEGWGLCVCVWNRPPPTSSRRGRQLEGRAPAQARARVTRPQAPCSLRTKMLLLPCCSWPAEYVSTVSAVMALQTCKSKRCSTTAVVHKRVVSQQLPRMKPPVGRGGRHAPRGVVRARPPA